LLRCRKAIKDMTGDNADQNTGIKILNRVIEEPLRQIVQNAGVEPSVIVHQCADGKGNFGYNAATGEFGDMFGMGILDPTKVTRFALQNASSIACLLLTTEAMIAELPKEEKGGGYPGGDMDEMM
jgi:chaperonin GroEL